MRRLRLQEFGILGLQSGENVQLALDRNATRDYLDIAALSDAMGPEKSIIALARMDELYPQKGSGPRSLESIAEESWIVRTQLAKQLADPRPYDLDAINLVEYKSIRPPYDEWDAVKDRCQRLSVVLTEYLVKEMEKNPAEVVARERKAFGDWMAAPPSQRLAPGKLPGLGRK